MRQVRRILGMSTRLWPPVRPGTPVVGAWIACTSWGSRALATTPQADAPSASVFQLVTSGPWLLATALLIVCVVGGLAWALGYAWGRQARPPSTPPASALEAAAATQAAMTQSAGRALPGSADAAEQPVAPAPVVAPANADEGLSFSYTVSHDLRAPVRVVDGFARILKEDYSRQLDRMANDHLDRILSAAARMNAMIDAMLSLAQLSTRPLARQRVNLSQLAGYIVDDLRRAQPERQVQVAIEPELQVMGDPTLIRQVLENLLSNAWKYTGHTDQARLGLSSSVQDGQQVFEVWDNGAGFDMRSAERLFGLFQRLHSANDFPGTGVGLASVQRIVQRHGGQIWAQSAPGQGARFCFTIGY